MTDDDRLRTDAARGARADRLMSDEMLVEAFDGLESEYFDAWKASQARDTEGRERLWQAAQIVGRVREHLKTMAATGRVAQKQLDEIARHGERPKAFGIF